MPTCYSAAGLEVEVLAGDDRKGHLYVTFPAGDRQRVDLLKEPLNFPPVMMSFGPVVSVTVRDVSAARALVEGNGFTVRELPGGFFVGAGQARGAAIAFLEV
jgi:hypothetical protein